MKKTIKWIVVLLLFFSGLATLLYPTASNLWNQYRSSRLLADYGESVSSMSEADTEEIWTQAVEYNETHEKNWIAADFTDDSEQEEKETEFGSYRNLLNPMGDGLMGYIEIPKIGEKLAVYHGTSTEVLEEGAGHVEGTSLPVGGASSHSVLAAHRGLPSAKLFTDLDEMQQGDLFYIHVLNRRLVYQVDQIQVVLPMETDTLDIEEGKDYVTLLTCTPYGVNSHRLLVRGVRIDDDSTEETVQSTAVEEEEKSLAWPALIFGFTAFGILVIVLYKRRRIWEKD